MFKCTFRQTFHYHHRLILYYVLLMTGSLHNTLGFLDIQQNKTTKLVLLVSSNVSKATSAITTNISIAVYSNTRNFYVHIYFLLYNAPPKLEFLSIYIFFSNDKLSFSEIQQWNSWRWVFMFLKQLAGKWCDWFQDVTAAFSYWHFNFLINNTFYYLSKHISVYLKKHITYWLWSES